MNALLLTISLIAPVLPVGPQAVFRSGVSIVRVEVLATAGGMPIDGLESRDFEVRDNGVLQQVEAVYREQQPLDVVLVLDRSGSMVGEPLRCLKEAAQALLGQLKEGDRASLITFADAQTLDPGFTSDTGRLKNAIARISAAGGTALLDAVYGAITLSDDTGRRTLIVLLTDGLDNRSWLSSPALVRIARESESVIAAVAFGAANPRTFDVIHPDRALLDDLTGQTGGETVVVERPADLTKAFLEIVKRMRARYLLTYYPAGVERSGWHALTVRLKGRRGNVVARRGYFVRPKQ